MAALRRRPLAPSLLDATKPRIELDHDGYRWGAVVRHGMLIYGLSHGDGAGPVFPVRRFTRRGIRRAAHRLLASYRRTTARNGARRP